MSSVIVRDVAMFGAALVASAAITPAARRLALRTVFVDLAVTNAFNLLDNMDGLAAGTAAIAASFFFVAAVVEGQHLVGAMALAVAGCCFGFLPYNFHPAWIFLGDTGSLFLGFLL